MNREVHVQFREERGVKSPLLTRLPAGLRPKMLCQFVSLILDLLLIHCLICDDILSK
jgi:hypothetical protein